MADEQMSDAGPREFDIYQDEFGDYDAFPTGTRSNKYLRATPIRVIEISDTERVAVNVYKTMHELEKLKADALSAKVRELEAELYQTKIALDQEKFSRANAFEKWQSSMAREEAIEKQLAESTAKVAELKGKLNHCGVTGAAVAKERDQLQSRLAECEVMSNAKGDALDVMKAAFKKLEEKLAAAEAQIPKRCKLSRTLEGEK